MSVVVNISLKAEIELSRSPLFYMKARACCKYFVNDCR